MEICTVLVEVNTQSTAITTSTRIYK